MKPAKNLLKTSLFYILLLAFSANGQLYTYQNLNHKNGLILNSTYTIHQAADGGILIGTLGAGIVEFDGGGFRELAVSGQDLDHHIRGMIAIDDHILFASQYKGIFKLMPSGKIRKIISVKNVADYWNVFQTKRDIIFTHSKGIIRIRDGAHTKLLDIPRQFGDLVVSETIHTPEGTIILSNHDHYMIDYETGELSLLSDYFNLPQTELEAMQFGYYGELGIHLFTADLKNAICLERPPQGGRYTIERKPSTGLPAELPAPVAATTYNKRKECFSVVLDNGQILEESEHQFSTISLNYDKGISKINKLIADKFGDYWITSDINGIFKVSLEPFTKLNFHSEYHSGQIRFTFKTNTGKLLFSVLGENSFYGDIQHGTLRHFSLGVMSATYHNGTLYCGTTKGLYIFNEQTGQFTEVGFPSIVKGKPIHMLISDGKHLWIGAGNIGMVKVDFEGRNMMHFSPEPYIYPEYCYSAQLSFDRRYLYVGSNTGIYRFGTESNTVKHMKTAELGSYCGLSVKDVFGTNWFTLEKGIVGITKRGELIKLSDNSLFPSFLFYTLNSDSYGNLILGTNRGLNVLRVNDEGKVLSQATYEGKTGFEGYETHMRSSFQNDMEIFFGTAEGLFYVNPAVLQSIKNPFPPCIRLTNREDAQSSGNFRFNVISKNPKSKTLYYTYRIKEVNSKWSELSGTSNFIVGNLENGKYTLEVRATYDGYSYSPSESFSFAVDMPIYRSNWFIVAIIIVIIGLNVYFLTRSKNLYPTQLFYSEEFFIIQKLAPNLILFGAIANSFAHLIAPMIDSNFNGNAPLSIAVGMVILSIFFIALNNRNNGNIAALKRNLTVSFVIIMSHNIYGIYVSSMHPFYALAVIIVGSIAPFIFERIQSILIYAVCFIVVNGALILSTNDANYNKYLYLIAVFISAFLVVLMTYIRHDSIHKLVFISSVINKGNIPAVAFDRTGKIIYISRNISKFIPATQYDLLNKPVSMLNQFIPQGEAQHNIDLTSEFRDGQNYIVPMLKSPEEVIWIEWSCKEFSSDVKVILGQNITARMELQNTYEVLVQNAEDFIYQVDVNGMFKFFNNRFYDRLNYRAEELLGKDSLQLVAPDYRKMVGDFYRNHFLEKKKTSYLEFPVLKSDGGIIWLAQYLTALYQTSKKDHVTGFLALGRDITEKRAQDQIIATQSEDIKSSINYAKRIQMNLLPSTEVLNEYFDESFVFYQPKDIVSGDFYWCKQIDGYTVVAVADCTGHGVPGAFMSLLGINLLNSIIQQTPISNPGRTLDELDYRLRQMLPSSGDIDQVKDGMEITLCVFDNKSANMSYACAGSKILVHNGNNFNLYKGDNKHIGDERIPGFVGYVTHHITIETNSTVYLFTDGFQDQFGGRQDKKYSFRRLLELFEENIRLPLSAQVDMIAEEFETWKADEPQTDDVTILAIRKKVKK